MPIQARIGTITARNAAAASSRPGAAPGRAIRLHAVRAAARPVRRDDEEELPRERIEERHPVGIGAQLADLHERHDRAGDGRSGERPPSGVAHQKGSAIAKPAQQHGDVQRQ